MVFGPSIRHLTTILVVTSSCLVHGGPLTPSSHAPAKRTCAFVAPRAGGIKYRGRVQNGAVMDIVRPLLSPLDASAGGGSIDPLGGIISNLDMPGRKIAAEEETPSGAENDALKEKAKSTLEKWISTEPVLVLVTSGCRFCSKAVHFLGEEGVEKSKLKVIDLNEDEQVPPLLRTAMSSSIGRNSVPAIWIGGEFVGGCNDGGTHGGGLMGLLDERAEGDGDETRLRQMLSDAGAFSD